MTLQIGEAEVQSVWDLGYETSWFNTEQNHLPQLSETEIKAVFSCFVWFSVTGTDGEVVRRSFADSAVQFAHEVLESGFVEGYCAFFDATTQPAM